MEHTSNISFPGLGIGEFRLNNVAFTIFGRPVMWYGVIICIGIILAFIYFAYRAGKAKIKLDDVIDTTLIAVPSAIVGARLYYVIFYGNVHSFYDVIAIWNGGLAIYGGIIGGMIAVILVAKHKKIDFFKYADMIIPAVKMGQLLQWRSLRRTCFPLSSAVFSPHGTSEREHNARFRHNRNGIRPPDVPL